MGGNKKQSGKARASASRASHAAAMLQQSGMEGFVPFGGAPSSSWNDAGSAADSSSSLAPDSPAAKQSSSLSVQYKCEDHQIQNAMRKLSKKDEVTRWKALDELYKYVSNGSNLSLTDKLALCEDLASFMKKIGVYDNSRRIRELFFKLWLEAVSLLPDKNAIGRLIPKVFGDWVCFDETKSTHRVWPEEEKRKAVWKKMEDRLYAYVEEMLKLNPESLRMKNDESKEASTERYERIISTVLSGLGKYIHALYRQTSPSPTSKSPPPVSDFSNLQRLIVKTLLAKAIWRAKSEVHRRHTYKCMLEIMEAVPAVVGECREEILKAVTDGLVDKTPSNVPLLLDVLLHLAASQSPSCSLSSPLTMSLSPHFASRLFGALTIYRQTSASDCLSRLLPTFAILPLSLITRESFLAKWEAFVADVLSGPVAIDRVEVVLLLSQAHVLLYKRWKESCDSDPEGFAVVIRVFLSLLRVNAIKALKLLRNSTLYVETAEEFWTAVEERMAEESDAEIQHANALAVIELTPLICSEICSLRRSIAGSCGSSASPAPSPCKTLAVDIDESAYLRIRAVERQTISSLLRRSWKAISGVDLLQSLEKVYQTCSALAEAEVSLPTAEESDSGVEGGEREIRSCGESDAQPKSLRSAFTVFAGQCMDDRMADDVIRSYCHTTGAVSYEQSDSNNSAGPLLRFILSIPQLRDHFTTVLAAHLPHPFERLHSAADCWWCANHSDLRGWDSGVNIAHRFLAMYKRHFGALPHSIDPQRCFQNVLTNVCSEHVDVWDVRRVAFLRDLVRFIPAEETFAAEELVTSLTLLQNKLQHTPFSELQTTADVIDIVSQVLRVCTQREALRRGVAEGGREVLGALYAVLVDTVACWLFAGDESLANGEWTIGQLRAVLHATTMKKLPPLFTASVEAVAYIYVLATRDERNALISQGLKTLPQQSSDAEIAAVLLLLGGSTTLADCRITDLATSSDRVAPHGAGTDGCRSAGDCTSHSCLAHLITGLPEAIFPFDEISTPRTAAVCNYSFFGRPCMIMDACSARLQDIPPHTVLPICAGSLYWGGIPDTGGSRFVRWSSTIHELSAKLPDLGKDIVQLITVSVVIAPSDLFNQFMSVIYQLLADTGVVRPLDHLRELQRSVNGGADSDSDKCCPHSDPHWVIDALVRSREFYTSPVLTKVLDISTRYHGAAATVTQYLKVVHEFPATGESIDSNRALFLYRVGRYLVEVLANSTKLCDDEKEKATFSAAVMDAFREHFDRQNPLAVLQIYVCGLIGVLRELPDMCSEALTLWNTKVALEAALDGPIIVKVSTIQLAILAYTHQKSLSGADEMPVEWNSATQKIDQLVLDVVSQLMDELDHTERQRWICQFALSTLVYWVCIHRPLSALTDLLIRLLVRTLSVISETSGTCSGSSGGACGNALNVVYFSADTTLRFCAGMVAENMPVLRERVAETLSPESVCNLLKSCSASTTLPRMEVGCKSSCAVINVMCLQSISLSLLSSLLPTHTSHQLLQSPDDDWRSVCTKNADVWIAAACKLNPKHSSPEESVSEELSAAEKTETLLRGLAVFLGSGWERIYDNSAEDVEIESVALDPKLAEYVKDCDTTEHLSVRVLRDPQHWSPCIVGGRYLSSMFWDFVIQTALSVAEEGTSSRALADHLLNEIQERDILIKLLNISAIYLFPTGCERSASDDLNVESVLTERWSTEVVERTWRKFAGVGSAVIVEDFLQAVDSNCLDSHAIGDFFFRSFLRITSLYPSICRKWYNNSLHRSLIRPLRHFFENRISEHMRRREIESICCQRDQINSEDLSVQASVQTGRISCTYARDDFLISLALSLPPTFPLLPIEIHPDRRLGVSQSLWNRWQLCLTTLVQTNGLGLVRALSVFKDVLDRHFEGYEDCPICYAVVHMSDYTLPKIRCNTCGKKFHAKCLYKWFQTSPNSTCPMCRSHF